MAEKILMKGNEAIAISAIRNGVDGYFGYPITPQSEVMETLMKEKPWETTGMVVLQAESETSSINMVYGGASCGKKVMTSSSSPGVSLMCEGISYMAGAELPCVVVDVMRGGPGLGTIQPSQSDYNQIVKGGGHGDYHNIVIAPASAQDMYDFVDWGFELAFKYRNPVVVLADGIIGQMMEKVEMHDIQERFNRKLKNKYDIIEETEVKYSEYMTEDAEYVFVAFGCSSRICEAVVDELRADGVKAGLLRPITLYPFPKDEIARLGRQVKSMMSVELNLGQMVDDVRLAVNGSCPVYFYGRQGGNIYTPEEIVAEFRKANGLA